MDLGFKGPKPLFHSSQKPTRKLAASAFNWLRLDESSRSELGSWLLRWVEKCLKDLDFVLIIAIYILQNKSGTNKGRSRLSAASALIRLALRFHIFLSWYRVNATPKRTEIVSFSNSAGIVWMASKSPCARDQLKLFIKNARCATRIHNKVLRRSLIVKFFTIRERFKTLKLFTCVFKETKMTPKES